MILSFISSFLIGAALVKLGTYAAVISMIETLTKTVAVLLLITALVLLYRHYKGSHRQTEPKLLSD